MKVRNFTMLIGLPASGKSTYAEYLVKKHYKICSSDNVRKQLFGDESIQGDSSEVFKVLHEQVMTAFEDGYNVVYDATNVTIKNRKSILDKIKVLNNNGFAINTTAVVFAIPIEECIYRNNLRERVVPLEVIYNMRAKFQLPLRNEGFDEILFEFSSNTIFKDYVYMYYEMSNFNQNNYHHDYTLDKHCTLTENYIQDVSCEDKIDNLFIAAKLHDYGKLFTKTTDDNGVSHYYSHDNVGAYEVISRLDMGACKTTWDLYEIGLYINYHMLPFQIKHMSKNKLNYYINLFGLEYWNNLLLLHQADINSMKDSVTNNEEG